MLKTFTQCTLFSATVANLAVLLAMKVATDRGGFPNFAQLPVSPYTCLPLLAMGLVGWLLVAKRQR